MMVEWMLLWDPARRVNKAAVVMECDTRRIRCFSYDKELSSALEEGPVRVSAVTERKVGSVMILSEVQVDDTTIILEETVLPYLNPLKIGARGTFMLGLEESLSYLSHYVPK